MSDRDWIVETIGSASFEKLASGLATSQLHSVLLEVMQRRAGARSPPDVLEHAYYSGGLRFQIWVSAPDGSDVPPIDGGAFDWLVKLASDRRAAYAATGAGSQLVALRFRKSEHRARSDRRYP